MLPDFRLETYFSRWEFRAQFNLAASDVESMRVDELLALGEPDDLQRWRELRLGYTETFGSPALRRAIADTYRVIDYDHILCFAGAQEGIFCAMHALLDPGDHVIVVVPNYQSTEEVPLSICAVTGVELRHVDGAWRLDLDDVRAAVRPNTKLISLNFPNNPTGAVIDRGTFDAIIELAAEHGIWVFSDEVYRGLEREPGRMLPNAADVYPRGLSLGVMSKSYGLPGLRVGWIACQDSSVLTRLERMKHYVSICNAGPSEVLATIALKAGDTILERNRLLVRDNAGRVTAFMSRYPELFDWHEPDGGCIAFPRYLGAEGVDEFCRASVEESGVLLLPNSVYQSRVSPVPSDRFRIGFGRRNVSEALARLDEHLTTHLSAGATSGR